MKDCQIQHFTGYPGESMKLTTERMSEVLRALCIDRNSLACKRHRVTRYFLQSILKEALDKLKNYFS